MHYFSVNGRAKNSIVINDRALSYGDGIFTTAKISKGKIEFLSSHLQRLITGCEFLDISFDPSLRLTKEITTVAKQYESAVIKVVITAGAGGRGYSRGGTQKPNVIVSVTDCPIQYKQWENEGIRVLNCELQLGINPLLKGIKHLNRLEQVLIRSALDKIPQEEFIVTDINDYIVESSCANVFWFRDDKLFTPDIDVAGILGVYRKNILSFEPSTQIVKEKLTDLHNITAMFICNSIMGIIPVKQYQNRQLDISAVITFKAKFLSHIQSKVV